MKPILDKNDTAFENVNSNIIMKIIRSDEILHCLLSVSAQLENAIIEGNFFFSELEKF